MWWLIWRYVFPYPVFHHSFEGIWVLGFPHRILEKVGLDSWWLRFKPHQLSILYTNNSNVLHLLSWGRGTDDMFRSIIGELIYTCKMIQPGIFSRFSQPVHFSRFKPDNLLLSTARFSGYNLEKYTGCLNLEKMPGWIILQV